MRTSRALFAVAIAAAAFPVLTPGPLRSQGDGPIVAVGGEGGPCAAQVRDLLEILRRVNGGGVPGRENIIFPPGNGAEIEIAERTRVADALLSCALGYAQTQCADSHRALAEGRRTAFATRADLQTLLGRNLGGANSLPNSESLDAVQGALRDFSQRVAQVSKTEGELRRCVGRLNIQLPSDYQLAGRFQADLFGARAD